MVTMRKDGLKVTSLDSGSRDCVIIQGNTVHPDFIEGFYERNFRTSTQAQHELFNQVNHFMTQSLDSE